MISIIIPLYNAEKYIYTTLSNIRNQTYSNYEIIIVDDCSKDDSILVINKFIKDNNINSKKIKVIQNKTNLGPGISRNVGIENSNGDNIFFMDSDDLIDNKCLEIMSNMIKNVDCVICSFEVINPDLEEPPSLSQQKKSSWYSDTGYYYGKDINETKIFATPWGKLIKKEFLIQNNLYFSDAYRGEDVNWWSICKILIDRIYILNDYPLYFYRKEHNSITTANNDKNYLYEQDFKSLNHTYKFICTLNDDKKCQFNNYKAKLIIEYFINYRTLLLKKIFRDNINKKKYYYEELRKLDLPIIRKRICIYNIKYILYNLHMLFSLDIGFLIMKQISKAKKY